MTSVVGTGAGSQIDDVYTLLGRHVRLRETTTIILLFEKITLFLSLNLKNGVVLVGYSLGLNTHTNTYMETHLNTYTYTCTPLHTHTHTHTSYTRTRTHTTTHIYNSLHTIESIAKRLRLFKPNG